MTHLLFLFIASFIGVAIYQVILAPVARVSWRYRKEIWQKVKR